MDQDDIGSLCMEANWIVQELQGGFQSNESPEWFIEQIHEKCREEGLDTFFPLMYLLADAIKEQRLDLVKEVYVTQNLKTISPPVPDPTMGIKEKFSLLYWLLDLTNCDGVIGAVQSMDPDLFDEMDSDTLRILLQRAVFWGKIKSMTVLLATSDASLSFDDIRALLDQNYHEDWNRSKSLDCKRILLQSIDLDKLSELIDNDNETFGIQVKHRSRELTGKSIEIIPWIDFLPSNTARKDCDKIQAELQASDEKSKQSLFQVAWDLADMDFGLGMLEWLIQNSMKIQNGTWDGIKENILRHLPVEIMERFNENPKLQGFMLYGSKVDWNQMVMFSNIMDSVKSSCSKDDFLNDPTHGLGSGAAGFVSKVYHKTDSNRVFPLAAKLVQFQLDQAKDEVKALEKLSHPNIVHCFHSFTERVEDFDRFYIIMECCDSDLDKEIAKHKNGMEVPEIMELMEQMAKATSYLQRKSIIHRDIKPPNILVNWKPIGSTNGVRPHYKMADFGCVKNLSDGARRLESIQTLTRVGTTAYMAPEMFQERQIRDFERKKYLVRYNAMVDSWSLGIVFLHCYHGKLPQDTHQPQEEIFAIKDTGTKLKTVLETLLKQDPSERNYLHKILKQLENEQ